MAAVKGHAVYKTAQRRVAVAPKTVRVSQMKRQNRIAITVPFQGWRKDDAKRKSSDSLAKQSG
jgi:hypothetical protein